MPRLGLDSLVEHEWLRSTPVAAVYRDIAAGHLSWRLAVDEPAPSPVERALLHVASGITAYLRGDLSLATRQLGSPEASCVPADLFAMPARVLTALAAGRCESARIILQQHESPLISVETALIALIGGDDFGQLSRTETIEETDPVIGAAAVAALTSLDGGDRRLEERLELLQAVVDSGCEFPTMLPVSTRRALAMGRAATGDLDAALEQLGLAEQLCRRESAFCELVEVLLALAIVSGRSERAADAGDHALGAYHIAERLGMENARRRAADLHRSTAKLVDQNSPPDRMVIMSDVVGSTTVSQQFGDKAYYELVMEHHELVRHQLQEHGGIEFSEGGDSLFAWFNSAADALGCAVAIQADAEAGRRAGSRLKIRVGVAGGHLFFSPDGERPYGSAVNRVARLTSQAPPDQIVTDELTMSTMSAVVDGFRIEEVDLRGLGSEKMGILDIAHLSD